MGSFECDNSQVENEDPNKLKTCKAECKIFSQTIFYLAIINQEPFYSGNVTHSDVTFLNKHGEPAADHEGTPEIVNQTDS